MEKFSLIRTYNSRRFSSLYFIKERIDMSIHRKLLLPLPHIRSLKEGLLLWLAFFISAFILNFYLILENQKLQNSPKSHLYVSATHYFEVMPNSKSDMKLEDRWANLGRNASEKAHWFRRILLYSFYRYSSASFFFSSMLSSLLKECTSRNDYPCIFRCPQRQKYLQTSVFLSRNMILSFRALISFSLILWTFISVGMYHRCPERIKHRKYRMSS